MSNLISGLVQRRRIGSPTRKAVLLYMADKAADDGSGIWTSKANIARDLELSRRTVQLVVRELIEAGLLVEIGQRNCKHGYTVEYAIRDEAIEALPSTRERAVETPQAELTSPVDNPRQTREPDSPRERPARVTRESHSPLPANQIHPNHPKNLTTTCARESSPVDNSDPQARCLAVAGPGLCPASRDAITATAEVIDGWLKDGIDLEADILPVIRARTPSVRMSPIRTWGYFGDAVREAHKARLAHEATGGDSDLSARLRFYADWVNAERYLPANAISNTIARALVTAGLVSRERLRERSIPVPELAEATAREGCA